MTIFDMEEQSDEKIGDKKNGEKKPIDEKCDKNVGDTEEKGKTRVLDMQPPQVSSSGGLLEQLVRAWTYFMQAF